MDVWVVPQSSCSGLDKGFLMDGGPRRANDSPGEVASAEIGSARDASRLGSNPVPPSVFHKSPSSFPAVGFFVEFLLFPLFVPVQKLRCFARGIFRFCS